MVTVPCKEGDENIDYDILIYPNPASSLITIETNSNEHKTIELTDALGQIIRTINTAENNTNLNIEDVSAGIYFVKIIVNNNSIIKKIVIE